MPVMIKNTINHSWKTNNNNKNNKIKKQKKLVKELKLITQLPKTIENPNIFNIKLVTMKHKKLSLNNLRL